MDMARHCDPFPNGHRVDEKCARGSTWLGVERKVVSLTLGIILSEGPRACGESNEGESVFDFSEQLAPT